MSLYMRHYRFYFMEQNSSSTYNHFLHCFKKKTMTIFEKISQPKFTPKHAKFNINYNLIKNNITLGIKYGLCGHKGGITNLIKSIDLYTLCMHIRIGQSFWLSTIYRSCINQTNSCSQKKDNIKFWIVHASCQSSNK